MEPTTDPAALQARTDRTLRESATILALIAEARQQAALLTQAYATVLEETLEAADNARR